MNKRIFISHSSKDFEVAMRLCQTLEERGLMCWIAPRDIPYGNIWAAEITEGISGADLLIFIISEHSVRSSQVVKELELALKEGKKLIPVRLDETKLSGALAYYLSDRQHILIGEDEEADFAKLVDYADRYLNGEKDEAASEQGKKKEESEEVSEEFVDVDVDAQLDAKFAELFGPERKEIKQEVEPFRKKLLDRIALNYMRRMLEEPEVEETEEKAPEFREPEIDEEPEDKWFDLTDKEGKTLIFLIRRVIDPYTLDVSFQAEELEYEDKEREDGSINRDFHIKRPDRRGNPVIILTFLKEQNMVISNMGFVDPVEGKIKFSKMPQTMPFSKNMGNEQPAQKQRYHASEVSTKIIVDPAAGKVVHREKVYDSKKKEWFTILELIPGHKYFAFEVKQNGEKNANEPDYAEVGEGFFFGRYGLPRNMLRAAECFEKAATPESWYYLGRIFKEDELLHDDDDAKAYLQMAADAGIEKAKTLLESL